MLQSAELPWDGAGTGTSPGVAPLLCFSLFPVLLHPLLPSTLSWEHFLTKSLVNEVSSQGLLLNLTPHRSEQDRGSRLGKEMGPGKKEGAGSFANVQASRGALSEDMASTEVGKRSSENVLEPVGEWTVSLED